MTPEPWLGQAYLVPFWSNKLECHEATLIPGYRGLITLARRSGELRTVKAAAVYEREPFEWDRMYPERSKHGYVDGDPGELKGAWTLWTFKGDMVTGDVMTIHEIDKIMQRTKSRNKKGDIVGITPSLSLPDKGSLLTRAISISASRSRITSRA